MLKEDRTSNDQHSSINKEGHIEGGDSINLRQEEHLTPLLHRCLGASQALRSEKRMQKDVVGHDSSAQDAHRNKNAARSDMRNKQPCTDLRPVWMHKRGLEDIDQTDN